MARDLLLQGAWPIADNLFQTEVRLDQVATNHHLILRDSAFCHTHLLCLFNNIFINSMLRLGIMIHQSTMANWFYIKPGLSLGIIDFTNWLTSWRMMEIYHNYYHSLWWRYITIHTLQIGLGVMMEIY